MGRKGRGGREREGEGEGRGGEGRRERGKVATLPLKAHLFEERFKNEAKRDPQ